MRKSNTTKMFRTGILFILYLFVTASGVGAQTIYYKNPDQKMITQFHDSANRVINIDSNSLLKKQFDYILKFYPKMLVKNIVVKFNFKKDVVKIKPQFASIFKMPSQRVYTIYFSKGTKSTLDSVLLENLSFNSQLGLIGTHMSMIEDLSTGGFFNFLGWYLKHLSHRGSKRIRAEAERRTLEVGLGYQLLAWNTETNLKLQIDNWMDTKGYSNYFKHYKNREMKPQLILNFIHDMPVYQNNVYQ